MQQVTLHLAEERDCGLLALLNRELILAEHSDNEMSYVTLKDRMQTFLRGTYRAWIFRADNVIVGYALVDMGVEPYFLRQFCILESMRGKGFGRAAFIELQRMFGAIELDVDVLVWNVAGAAFWHKMGFVPRYTRMRMAASTTELNPES